MLSSLQGVPSFCSFFLRHAFSLPFSDSEHTELQCVTPFLFTLFVWLSLFFGTRIHRTSVCASISLCMAFSFCWTHTGLPCVPQFLFVWPSFSDSTHRTSLCSFHVTLIRISSLDTQQLSSCRFLSVSYVVAPFRLDLVLRTHCHTPSTAVTSAPPSSLASFIGSSNLRFFISFVRFRHE